MACNCGRHKTPQGCAGARHFARLTLTERQRFGHEGGAAQAFLQRQRRVERYAHLDRDDAIWQAWTEGLHARKMRAQRMRKSQQRAA